MIETYVKIYSIWVLLNPVNSGIQVLHFRKHWSADYSLTFFLSFNSSHALPITFQIPPFQS